MRKILLASVLIMSGCANENTSSYVTDGDMEEMQSSIDELTTRVEEMEITIDDLEYQLELLTYDNQDLLNQMESYNQNGYNEYVPEIEFKPYKPPKPIELPPLDRDIDNDGMWDYDSGGVDRDLDNDGLWDQ